MKKAKPIVIIVLVALLFTIIIPIAINESYKHSVIYITKWDASDVLSYYGTLLGAATTVAALILTIAFTKKQIQHDNYLNRHYAEWKKIESIITQVLTDISPLNINNFNNSEPIGNADFRTLLTMLMHVQSYEITIKASLDTLKCHIHPNANPQMSDFEKNLSDCITQFYELEKELKGHIWSLIIAASINQGVVPTSAVYIFSTESNKTNQKILSAHDGPYQDLLSKKREVFDRIYTDVEQQAEKILQFKKRKKNSHAHT